MSEPGPRAKDVAFSDFHEEHALPDGLRVTLRAIRPDDGPDLRRSFDRLSLRSRHQRFLGGVTELTDAMVEYLTNVDGYDHVALVCTTESHDLKAEVGLGVARFVRSRDEPDVAEAAITVLDEAQGRGVGRLLLRALATHALARGVRVFRGEILADNVRMRHLLQEVSGGSHTIGPVEPAQGDEEREHGPPVTTLVFDIPLQEADDKLEREPTHPLRRLFRAIAEELKKLPHTPRADPSSDNRA